MTPEVNLAYYREEDWERFLVSIDDRDSMHDTWKEWHSAYLNAKINLVLEGFTVNDFVVLQFPVVAVTVYVVRTVGDKTGFTIAGSLTPVVGVHV